MKAVIYNTIDQSVIKEWQALWEKSSFATYTNSPMWFLSNLKAFPTNDIAIVAIYDKETLVAAGALVKVRKYGLDFYTISPPDYIIGVPFLLDMDNKKVMENFVRKLMELGNIFFDNVPEEFLTKLHNYTSAINEIVQTLNLYLPVRKNEHGQTIVPKRSRMMNRINGQEKDFIMRSFDGTTAEGLDIVYTIDDESSKKEKGYSTFACEEIRVFYSELAKSFKENFCVDIMYYKEKPIAYYIGFIVGKSYYWSQNAYISEYGQFSPGKVLLVKLIEHWGEKGIEKIDFGSGDNRMKRELTDHHEKLYQIVLSQSSMTRMYVEKVMSFKNDMYARFRKKPYAYSLYRKIKSKI